MTDKEKLEKLVAYLVRRMYAHNQMADIGSTGEIFDEKIENAKYEECRDTLNFIDSMQEEPVRIKKGCKYRCLSDMQNTDTGAFSFFKDKIYFAPKDDTLVSEENGWLCDTSENTSNFELVEEPASEEQVKELAGNQHEDKTCKENGDSLTQEPVSEDLEQAIDTYLATYFGGEKEKQEWPFLKKMTIHFANLQKKKDDYAIEIAHMAGEEEGKNIMKQQMMAKAVDGVVHRFNGCGVVSVHYNDPNGIPMAYFIPSEGLSAGDKVKIITIKKG